MWRLLAKLTYLALSLGNLFVQASSGVPHRKALWRKKPNELRLESLIYVRHAVVKPFHEPHPDDMDRAWVGTVHNLRCLSNNGDQLSRIPLCQSPHEMVGELTHDRERFPLDSPPDNTPAHVGKRRSGVDENIDC